MIIDNLENLPLYTGVMKELGEVHRIMAEGHFELGAVLVNDSMRYATSEYETREKGLKGYETHKEYADVQIILSGHEVIDIGKAGTLEKRSEYSKSDDIQFFSAEKLASYRAMPGYFILLLPGEAHEPCLDDGEKSRIRKVVFKIKCGK